MDNQEGAVLAIWGEVPAPEAFPELKAEFGCQFSAELADACLFDRIQPWVDGRIWPEGRRRVLVYAPSDLGSWFDARLPESFALQPQAEGGRSESVTEFFRGEFEEGASKVVLLIGESPNLDPSYVLSAFLGLEHRDFVVGPRTDGGIYLLGAKAPIGPLLDGLDWDGPDFLTYLCARIAEWEKSLSVLPPWHGLKSIPDCRALAGQLYALRVAGAPSGSPRVENLLLQPSR